ncbi:Deoxyribodipyrimidine photolyase [metagenome]
MPKYKKTLFIFRRDLRLEDNTGLIYALKNSEEVIPCFIIDVEIMNKLKKSIFRIKFLNESLLDLDEQLIKKNRRLKIFKGKTEEIVKKIILEQKIDGVFLNGDYTKFAQKKENQIKKICKQNKIDFNKHADYLLHIPDEIHTKEQKPYTVYSFFLKTAKSIPVRNSIKNNFTNYYQGKIIGESSLEIKEKNIENGGRKNAIKIIKKLKQFKDYQKTRDYPSLDKTTRLSAHIRFGTISIREVYHAINDNFGDNHVLINQIYWREFFTYVLHNFPNSQFKSFKKKFANIKWSKNKQDFLLWCNGETGFPIVDAGMRQLNKTGFMHNRVRMIVASFLTKDLHINWKWGERYFAEKLIDYDPAVNSGNWQWAASTGCDAVPYFRIFNPWLQQEKFDSDCKYIKKWISKLEHIESDEIHNHWKKQIDKSIYPKQIVNHIIEAIKTKDIFKKQL